METRRAYSVIELKEVNEERREITGLATTPATDRMGDVVVPEGAQFSLPVPFLWQHDRLEPIGSVTRAEVKKGGIQITATIPKVLGPSRLAARLDEAWESIKAGLVRGLSIGFSPIEWSETDMGYRFTRWDWLELSAVTIPANAEANIATIKSLAEQQRAEPRKIPVGVSAPKTICKKFNPKKIEEHAMTINVNDKIKEWEATRQAKSARMVAIIEAAEGEGRSLDAQEAEEYENLNLEVKAADEHLKRLNELAKLNAKTAQPVPDEMRKHETPRTAPAVVKSIKNDEPGIGIARLGMAMCIARGSVDGARAWIERNFANDIRLNGIMKAAVGAGSTTNPEWAGNLVEYQTMSSEFVEYLRPRTIIGQFGVGGVPALRRAPFNIRMPRKTRAGTASWVGEGYAKPVTSSGYDYLELKWAKIAAISAITEELNRFSDPSVQTLVRDDLAEAVIERMDMDFVNPAKGVGTGATASPASITNGVVAIPASGTTAADLNADLTALWEVADDTNLPANTAVYIMDSRTARAVAQMRNTLGTREYPTMGPTGGTIDGTPVIVSNYVPKDTSGSYIILVFASEIFLADDGIVTVDVSNEASLVMDTEAYNLSDSTTPTPAQVVSMWQTNSLAIKAERYVNWAKRRPEAVAMISGANYSAA